MSRTDYENEKMKLSAREKIQVGLKLFSSRHTLSRESKFLCVNGIGFSLVTVESLRD